jgi:hypothetical protein
MPTQCRRTTGFAVPLAREIHFRSLWIHITFSLVSRFDMPQFSKYSWTLIKAVQLHEGDILQNGNSPIITSDVKVLQVSREATRVIIRTTAWHTIKCPDDGILVKTPRVNKQKTGLSLFNCEDMAGLANLPSN